MEKRAIEWPGKLAVVLTLCLMSGACQTRRNEQTCGDAAAHAVHAIDAMFAKLDEIRVPEMSFRAPATIFDAVDWLRHAKLERDGSSTSLERQGIDIQVRGACHEGIDTNRFVIPVLSVHDVSLRVALRTLCKTADMSWRIRENNNNVCVVIVPRECLFDEDWATRAFAIPSAMAEAFSRSAVGHAPCNDPSQAWRTFFEQNGVLGAECGTVEYLPSIGKVRVSDTPENLAMLGALCDAFTPCPVEIEVLVYAFRAQDVEKLRLRDGVSAETLMNLRRKGKGVLVASATALAKSGQSMTVRAIREAGDTQERAPKDDRAASNAVSRCASGGSSSADTNGSGTGMVLQVLPMIRMDGKWIDLQVNPQWTTFDGGEPWPRDASGRKYSLPNVRQPVFPATRVETRVALAEGRASLIGSCSSPDGEWVQFCLLTARTHFGDKGKTCSSCGKKSSTRPQCGMDGRLAVQRRMRDIVIPELTFRQPTTVIDAVDHLIRLSRTHEMRKAGVDQGDLNFAMRLPLKCAVSAVTQDTADPFAAPVLELTTNGVPIVSPVSAHFVNLYDALELVCDVAGMKVLIKDGLVWVAPRDEAEGGMDTHFFPMDASAYAGLDAGRKEMGLQWYEFFSRQGVDFPAGASVAYVASINGFRVTNTLEDLDVFERVLHGVLCQFDVDVQIHAFRSDDIERLRMSGQGVSAETMTELRRQGKSHPVASASVLAAAGHEAVVRFVREVAWQTNSDDGGQRAADPSPGMEAGTERPGRVQKREVGMSLRVVPCAHNDLGEINLSINPEWVALGRPDEGTVKFVAEGLHGTIPTSCPVFEVMSCSTNARLLGDQTTVVLGSCSTLDGKWVQACFLTAKAANQD